MSVPSALFRPDALAGFGHLSRCLALAAAWTRSGGVAAVAADHLDDRWEARFAAVGAGRVELPEQQRYGWCILDGYRNDLVTQSAARTAHDRLLVIDDHGSLGQYDADLVLDQNVGARHGDLRGLRYLLLRAGFDDVAVATRHHGTTVLLAPGGAPGERTAAVFDGAAETLGAAGAAVTWLHGVDDVVAAMGRADVAIAAAGVTAYELCRMGVPAVLLAVADNQEPVARGLGDRGAALDAGRLDAVDGTVLASLALDLLADPERAATMRAVQQRLVDGRGAARVVAVMRSFDVDVRPATPDDARLTWTWANDPEVRRQSFSSEPIPWETHRTWFAEQIAADGAVAFLIGEIEGVPIGTVRLSAPPEGGPAILNYSVASEHRGQGLAAPLLVAATRHHTSTVEALVKATNLASARALDTAGFEPMGDEGDVRRFRLEP